MGIRILGNPHSDTQPTVVISDTTINNNTNGIYSQGVWAPASIEIRNSRISNNRRQGLINVYADVSLDGVSITGNGFGFEELFELEALHKAGGIENQGQMDIVASQITNNINGGILNLRFNSETIGGDGERMSIDRTTIDANSGFLAGVSNEGVTIIDNSTISFNENSSSNPVGGIRNIGLLTVNNSTISGNSTVALRSTAGSVWLNHVTIARNAGTGLHSSPLSVQNIRNSLIVENGDENCLWFGGGSIASDLSGINIASDGSCYFPEAYTAGEILLLELANNGGYTFTHALDIGSVAIDAASCTLVLD